MEIHLSGSRPTHRAPADKFTGTVWQDPVIMTPAPAHLNCSRVSFEPGARTAWHTHPLGQTLYVISGIGRVQAEGGPIREILPIGPFEVSVALPAGANVRGVRLLDSGKAVRGTKRGDRLAVTVPSIGLHEIVAFDLA